MNRGRARHSGHGEGTGAQRRGGTEQTLGQVGLTHQGDTQGIHGKNHYKHHHPAIGQHCTDQHGDPQGPANAETARNRLGNAAGRLTRSHDLAKDSATEEQHEELTGKGKGTQRAERKMLE
ncbi:hypothetical protein D9M68_798540 [compost metagenome]